MNSRSRLLLVTLFAGCLVTLLAWCISAAAQSPVAPCTVGVRAPAFGFWTWAQDAQVKVYLRAADFTSEEIPFLLAPLKDWNAANEQNGSGVRFEYQGKVTEPMLCLNCLTIIRSKVFDKTKRHAAELQAMSQQGTQVIRYASIVIDPAVTNPNSLTNMMAHELGHTVGLLDCFTCKQKSTVMNQFKKINVSNDMEGPSACDLTQVQAAYKELKRHPRPSPAPLVARVKPADEGEEPVDDDTPIVIRKP